jgi:hypothetical protein
MVYFFLAETVGLVKIGFTADGTPDRRRGDAETHCPVPLTVVATMPGGRRTERRLHERFAAQRVRREWFHAGPELVDFLARRASVTWTADGMVWAMGVRNPSIREAVQAWRGTWREKAWRRLVEAHL